MIEDEIAAALKRDPFIALRLHLRNGKSVKIPHRTAAWLLGGGVLVFKGKKEGSVVATGFEEFAFDSIKRIEKLPSNGHRRRKAS